jgi:signal peptidase I
VRLALWSANLLLLAVVGLAAWLFVVRELRFFVVPSGSMHPTLLEGDRIVTMNEPVYQRGDIVVIWDTDTAEFIVKRVAAVAGDEVKIEGGALFINGSYVSEPYIAEPMQYEFQPIGHIAEGQVLLLGDNRNQSADSSVTHKTYPVDDITGRVRFLYWPWERRGPVQRFALINATGD